MDERERPAPGDAIPAAAAGEVAAAGTSSEPAAESEPTPAAAPAESPGQPAEARVVNSKAAEARPAAAPPEPAIVPAPFVKLHGWDERPEIPIAIPRGRLAAASRRDFLLLAAGAAAAAATGWWWLPDRTKARLLPHAHDRLDTLAARLGLSRDSRERVLGRALTFDDDVAEALYSKDRRVRTYSRADVTPLRNNYAGLTPRAESLIGWNLEVSGLASGTTERFTLATLLGRFPLHGQVTRLCCVEGWSAVAWWGGLRFADFLAAFPPAPGMRWAAMRSALNLDGRGQPRPYYVSIDLDTARHPQTLLATHFHGRPLPPAHGAPLRLLVPMKLGLKNIKAITHITYVASGPPDYWSEHGYSKYDGL